MSRVRAAIRRLPIRVKLALISMGVMSVVMALSVYDGRSKSQRTPPTARSRASAHRMMTRRRLKVKRRVRFSLMRARLVPACM